MIDLRHGDCLEVLPTLPAGSVDCVLTDPPYGLEFMGKEWDRLGAGIEVASESTDQSHPFRNGTRRVRFGANAASAQQWHQQWASAVLPVLKPGGYMLCFGGTRTYHRLTCAVEDAGFQIRDCLMWIYGSGFPKGNGCLKPAWEPILLARKSGAKVLPLGIDGCRVPTNGPTARPPLSTNKHEGYRRPWNANHQARAGVEARRLEAHNKRDAVGRWPANVVHDGSEEVLEVFAAFGERGDGGKGVRRGGTSRGMGSGRLYAQDEYTSAMVRIDSDRRGDTGTAARFFYCAKASRSERGEGNTHPTVKPAALMEWLVKLICAKDGTVLDPFMGSGTTGVACLQTGRNFIGIEIDRNYFEIAQRRIAAEQAKSGLFAENTHAHEAQA